MDNNLVVAGGVAANPLAALPAVGQYDVAHAFGGGGKTTQSAHGDIYGDPGFNYNPNNQNFEQSVSNWLAKLSPEQMIQRYSDPNFRATSNAEQAYKTAYDTAKSLLGRDIEPGEFADILPYFQGPNGTIAGRQYVSQLAKQEKNDPLNPHSVYNPSNPKNVLGQQEGNVQGIFNDLLKRGATKDELSHFEGLLASGQLDPYTLKSFVQQMPEYQTQQDTQFRGGLEKELSGYDLDFFSKAKENVLSQFGNQGIAPGTSSSLDNALTDLMGNIAKERGQYLAGFSAQQYGGNKEAARDDYMTNMNRMFGQQDYTRGRQGQMQDYLLNRGYEGMDYQTQMNDYMNFMNKNKGSRGNPLYGGLGGLVGAGVGSFWGPAGATAGYSIGQGAGNTLDYLNH